MASNLTTVLRSAKDSVEISRELPTAIIGERINPTGRKLLAAEMAAGDMSRVKADAIAANPPAAVRRTKRLLREALALPLPAFLDLTSGMQAALHHSRDHKEAVAAILEKRPPQFTGE